MLRYFKRFFTTHQATTVSTVSCELCDLTVFLPNARSMLLHSHAMFLLFRKLGSSLIFRGCARYHTAQDMTYLVYEYWIRTDRSTDLVTTHLQDLPWSLCFIERETKEQAEDVKNHRNSFDLTTFLFELLCLSIYINLMMSSDRNSTRYFLCSWTFGCSGRLPLVPLAQESGRMKKVIRYCTHPIVWLFELCFLLLRETILGDTRELFIRKLNSYAFSRKNAT